MNVLFQRYFRQQGMLFRLIMVNIVVFIIITLIDLGFRLSGNPGEGFDTLWNYLSLSSNPGIFITRPWTIITYMFMHDQNSLMHIIFNMLLLYWFGRIFTDFRKESKILWVYIAGGMSGGFLYMLMYQLIPALNAQQPGLGLVGASAAVSAIIFATAFLVPEYGVNLLFIGEIRLKYIALLLIIIDIFSLKGNNPGGHFSHVGGAIFGMLYTLNLRGKIPVFRYIGNLFRLFNLRRKHGKIEDIRYKKVKEKESREKNYRSDDMQAVIDEILEKIHKSGYDSLTDEERETLFKASKK